MPLRQSLHWNFPPLLIYLMTVLLLTAAWGTGLATDDFVHLNTGIRAKTADMLLPSVYASVPVLHYTHALAFHLIGDHLWIYGLWKAVFLLLFLFALLQFFAQFFDIRRAWLGAIIMLCMPLHDGATLWLTGQYLIISLSFLLLAYTAANGRHFGWAAVLAVLGSFSSYGSTPIALGLTVMLMAQRNWRGCMSIALPNFAYCAYYAITSIWMQRGTARLPSTFEPLRFIKSYIAQILSFLDAGVGPSAWLKLALSIAEISLASAAIALVGAGLFWYFLPKATEMQSANMPNNTQLIWCTSVIALSAFGIFSLTGRYPQVAFNLGDRVMIYGSFLIATILLSFASLRILTCTALVTMVGFMGIADHWRAWNTEVSASIAGIRSQRASLQSFGDSDLLFVTGLQFSQLGPISHIDHFTSSYVSREIFSLSLPERKLFGLVAFTSRLQLDKDGDLVDTKYEERYKVAESISLYDARTNTLTKVPKSEIPARIAALPIEIRHWTQLLGPGMARDAIVWLMPTLRHAYQ